MATESRSRSYPISTGSYIRSVDPHSTLKLRRSVYVKPNRRTLHLKLPSSPSKSCVRWLSALAPGNTRWCVQTSNIGRDR